MVKQKETKETKETYTEEPMIESAMNLVDNGLLEDIEEPIQEEAPKKEFQILNAKMTTVDINIVNDNIITMKLSFDWDGYGQGVPLYDLSGVQLERWVKGIMKTIGVAEWSQVKNSYVRIIRESADYSANIIGIMNIITNETFMFNE